MLLLHVLGGVDLWLILLAYAAVATLAVFLVSVAIWVSTESFQGRQAASLSGLLIMAWLVVPTLLALVLPRFGLGLPEWARTVNAWLLASSPIGVTLRLAPSIPSWASLCDVVGWMMGLQLAGSILFLAAAILRLRRVYRQQAGGTSGSLAGRAGPTWRLRPRPAVGDDPILWREMYTTRTHGLVKAIGWLICLVQLAALAFGTYYFAKPALAEVWRYGYAVSLKGSAEPQFNLFVRIFVPSLGLNQPADMARVDFNIFVRYVTLLLNLIMAFMVAGITAEVLNLERAKKTWTSLLATPLSGRAILRAAILATAWRLRGLMAILVILWTIGLLAGAVHPLGYVAVALEMAASTWFLAALGALGAIQVKDPADATGRGLLWTLVLVGSGTLPLLLPSRFTSVLLGTGSPPLMVWLDLVSYRDLALAMQPGAYAPLQFMAILTGEGSSRVLASCVIGILAPALGGWCIWRYAVAHFDRLVGRPWRLKESIIAEPAVVPSTLRALS
jgi:hypothetical protein